MAQTWPRPSWYNVVFDPPLTAQPPRVRSAPTPTGFIVVDKDDDGRPRSEFSSSLKSLNTEFELRAAEVAEVMPNDYLIQSRDIIHDHLQPSLITCCHHYARET